jgi:hypothetical protein
MLPSSCCNSAAQFVFFLLFPTWNLQQVSSLIISHLHNSLPTFNCPNQSLSPLAVYRILLSLVLPQAHTTSVYSTCPKLHQSPTNYYYSAFNRGGNLPRARAQRPFSENYFAAVSLTPSHQSLYAHIHNRIL